jgi:hypothetical protein
MGPIRAERGGKVSRFSWSDWRVMESMLHEKIMECQNDMESSKSDPESAQYRYAKVKLDHYKKMLKKVQEEFIPLHS